jgi:hypothetical protein
MPDFTVIGLAHPGGQVTIAATIRGRHLTEDTGHTTGSGPGDPEGVAWHVGARDADDAEAAVMSGMRWNEHSNGLGGWCPWSDTHASPADLAEAARLGVRPACPAGCPGSSAAVRDGQ